MGRQRYWKQVREIAEEHDVSIPEARRKWREYYKPGGIRRIVLAVNAIAKHVSAVCPFCRDDLLDDEDLHVCPACKTKYHQECFDEFGTKCATLGCRGYVPRSRTTPTIHINQPRYRFEWEVALGLIIFIVIMLLIAIPLVVAA